jgi:hypothetical protein
VEAVQKHAYDDISLLCFGRRRGTPRWRCPGSPADLAESLGVERDLFSDLLDDDIASKETNDTEN